MMKRIGFYLSKGKSDNKIRGGLMKGKNGSKTDLGDFFCPRCGGSNFSCVRKDFFYLPLKQSKKILITEKKVEVVTEVFCKGCQTYIPILPIPCDQDLLRPAENAFSAILALAKNAFGRNAKVTCRRDRLCVVNNGLVQEVELAKTPGKVVRFIGLISIQAKAATKRKKQNFA